MHAKSIAGALEGLGVKCALASSDSDFLEQLATREWPTVFIALKQYEGARHIFRKIGFAPNIVLLAEFGEAGLHNKLSVLSEPVHSMSIANMLNGAADSFSYRENDEAVAMFIAPEAKILIVDDIDTNLKVAEGLMAPYKMQIDLRGSGPEAIEAVRVRPYDIVFMDHKMPGMDGVETARLIRGMGDAKLYCKNVPIIALTANAVMGMEEMFIENGFSDFLSKPIDTIKLNSILKKWVPRQKQMTGGHGQGAQGAAGFEVEGMDTNKGMLMSGGTLDAYFGTLEVFQKDGRRKAGEIRKCLGDGDIALFRTYVHGMKSACANIGAGGLSSLAEALEAAGAAGDRGFIEANTGEFLSSLESLLASLEGALERHSAERRHAAAPEDMAKAAPVLSKLKAALEELDVGGIDRALDSLQDMELGGAVGAALKEISENVLVAEYDEAISLVDGLLKTES
jgi:CheY-like chemotaxis protein